MKHLRLLPLLFSVLLLCLSPSFSLADPIVEFAGDDSLSLGNSNGGSDVRVLTDSNFEHDTQATTGATTGDWLIEFYAPWCGHCKSLAPTWEKLATRLKGRLSVAKLDGTTDVATSRRFKIEGFPTIKLLHHGQVYDYSGPRTVEALEEWATSGFRQTEAKPVPGEVGTLEVATEWLAQLGGDVEMMVMRKPSATAVIGGIGFLLGMLVSLIFMAACIDSRVPQVTTGQMLNSPIGSPSPSPAAQAAQPLPPAVKKAQ